MARKRVSMHDGPLAELFRATEASQGRPQAAPPGGRPLHHADSHRSGDPAPTEILSVVPDPVDEPDEEPLTLPEVEPASQNRSRDRPAAAGGGRGGRREAVCPLARTAAGEPRPA